jgi:secreted trypsin-like serine protease
VNYILTLLILLSLAACAERTAVQQGEILNPNSEDRGIVGGTSVAPLSKDAERTVLIIGKVKNKSSLCTGTMIADDVVLTAAHCVTDPKTIKIVFGTDPTHTGAVKITKLKSFVKHKKYNPNDVVRHDIALIQIENQKPANYKIARLPWDAPQAQSIFKITTPFKVMGYGTNSGFPVKNKGDLRGSGSLRTTELSIAKFSPTQDVFYADQTKGHAVCSGDSGGPAFIDDETVVGIVSYNVTDDPGNPELADDDVCNYQSVFTNVIQYKNWILGGLKAIKDLEKE